MRSQIRLALIFFFFFLVSPEALAGKRVAMVVGNSAYQNVPVLPNPVNDAAAMADLFKGAGFDVVQVYQDLKNSALRRTLNSFFDSVRDADVAVVYFAGHGIEIEGSNYIIPVDAVLERDRDVYDEAVSLDRIVQSIEPARKLRLVILDACRENPFTKSMRRSVAARGISRGLARVDPDTPNTLVAFAAKAGATAEDGVGEHSPFTTSLLKHLTVPGLDVRRALGLVRDEVMSSTNNRQEPFVFGSLGGADVALVPAPTVDPPPSSNNLADVRADYQLAERVGTEEAWDYFIAAHKSGFYSDLAKAQRNKLAAGSARNDFSEKGRVSAAATAQQPIDPSQENGGQGKLKVANLKDQLPLPAQDAPTDSKIAVSPKVIAPGREPLAKEVVDWESVKNTTDQSALESFIRRYPNSPLSITARQRLDALNRAAEEREAKARAEREAAIKKAAEDARIQAEQKKAELAKAAEEREAKARAEREAAKKAADEARLQAEQKKAELAKAAEEREAKARADREAAVKKAAEEREAKEQADREAAKKTAEDARVQAEQKKAELAKAAEEREAKARADREAAKKAAEDARIQAEQKKAELAAAKKREEEERLARAAEAERAAKEKAAEMKAAEAKKAAEEAERRKSEQEAEALRAAAAALRAAREQKDREAEAEQKKAELAAAQAKACKQEQTRFEELDAKGSGGTGVTDVQAFAKTVTCDPLRSQVAALVDRFKAEVAKRAMTSPNSPELVRAAQNELARIGCLSGKVDGSLETAKKALDRYAAITRSSPSPAEISEDVVSTLSKQTGRICPLECKSGETAKGEICVAADKPAKPTTASRRKHEDEDDDTRARRRAAPKVVAETPKRVRAAPAPQARQQAVARPPSEFSGGGGGGGGGARTMIGVGF
ncbi:caspase family protein [Bradyrhizobium ivorense]|uniref:caspase family protein n=1 Tax=Bradyrhizobium ivorense TaxID=2511166 RepID=UPI0027E32708|nr:caspase family protein [Bradyrhizobium ivorense]